MSIGNWLDIVGPWRQGRRIRQSRTDNCVQTVVAMALGLSIEDVEEFAGTTGCMTVDETLGLLNSMGIYCRPVAAALVADFWPVFYERHGSRRLRGLGFALPEEAAKPGHAFYISGSEMYDPATGEAQALSEESLKKLDWLALLPAESYKKTKMLPKKRVKPGGDKVKRKRKPTGDK